MAAFTLTSIVNATTVVISRFGVKGRWSKRTWALGAPSGSCLSCSKKCKTGDSCYVQGAAPGFICTACVEKQVVSCLFCGTKVPRGDIPVVTDNAAWAEIATQHSPSCEWVKTRGERKKPTTIKPRQWKGTDGGGWG